MLRSEYGSNSNTTFVTSWFHIYKDAIFDNKTTEWRFEQFEVILQSGIQICIYTSPEFYDKLCELSYKYTNLKVMNPIQLEHTRSYFVCNAFKRENIDLILPTNRHPIKDSYEYMILMSCKIEFLKDAILMDPWNSTHYAWIDFSIGYILNDKPRSIAYLKMLATRTFRPKMFAIPGCVSKFNEAEFSMLCEMPYWRFCGSFFLADKQSVLEFYDIYFAYFSDFLQEHKRLLWEVNYWAWLETVKGWSPDWYAADHNDSIFCLPLEFYAKCLDISTDKIIYPYPDLYEGDNQFLPSSASYAFYQGRHVLNTRFVNYSFTEEGRYSIRDPNKILYTNNVRCYLDASFTPICYGKMLEETVGLPSSDKFSHGLEDMRLFERNNQLYFIASNVNYSPSGKIRMMMGEYRPETLSYHNCLILDPPTDTWCEKNWIPLPGTNETPDFIYSWSPFQIGRLNDDNQLKIIYSRPLSAPHFHKVRGSSVFIRCDDGNLLGVVHFSEECHPRKYYHMLVCLDAATFLPISCSDPFCFQHYGVEFCIGFAIYDDDKYAFWVSKKDNDATMILIDRTQLVLSKI